MLDGAQLLVGVVGEAVDGDDGRDAEVADVLDVLGQVGKAVLERAVAVVLERPHGRDDNGGLGLEAADAALDVEELLGAQVGAEAGLGDDVVGQLEGHLGGEEGVAAVGDVGEGAAVDEGGRVLERLHDVRLDGVAEEDDHGRVRL